MAVRVDRVVRWMVAGWAALVGAAAAQQCPAGEPLAQAERHLSSGRVSEAAVGFEALRNAAGGSQRAAAIDGLGLVNAARGRRLAAERLHREAIAAFEAAGDMSGAARARHNLALATVSGLIEPPWIDTIRSRRFAVDSEPSLRAAAAQRFADAGRAALAAQDAPLAARSFAQAARAAARAGEGAQAAGFVAQAFSVASGAGLDADARAQALIAALDAALHASALDPGAAASVFLLADIVAATTTAADGAENGELKGLARGFAARAYGLAGRPAEARALSQQAAFLLAEAGAPEAGAVWLGQAGAFAEVAGDPAAARALYDRATQVLLADRGDLIPLDVSAGRAGLIADLIPLLAARTDFLLAQSPAAAAPARDGALEEARGVIELARAIEIEMFAGDPCVRRGISADLDDLPDGAAVLYPILRPGGQLEVMVSTRAGSVLRRSPVSAAAAAAAAERFRISLTPDTLSDDYAADAKLLHEAILAPAREALVGQGVTTILYAPDGPVRDAPLAAFIAPDGRFVAEDFAVATVMGLSLLDPTVSPDRPWQAFVGGLSQSVEGFSPLPAVPGEVAAVSAQLPAVTALDEGFTRASLERNLSADKLNIVHLATHGSFAGAAKESFILGHGGPIYLDELNAIASRARVRDAAINLLTLSACETAAGDDRAVMGIAGAAFASGAETVIGALWQVSDESTAVLFGNFYADMARSQAQGAARDKAQALAQAQRAAIAAGRHPSEWAGFILIGKWR